MIRRLGIVLFMVLTVWAVTGASGIERLRTKLFDIADRAPGTVGFSGKYITLPNLMFLHHIWKRNN